MANSHFLVAGLVATGAAGSALHAQSPAFEVASVRVNKTDSGGSNFPRLTKGTLMAQNVTMRMILQSAYGLTALQITGPGWLDSDHFDLAGKAPAGVPDTEVMPMLQSLLKERFQLAAHRETKEMPVYNLVVAKDGLKISPFDPAHPPATPPRNGAASMIMGPGTMSGLASMLVSAAGRPVIDKTGLEGRYGYAFTFSPMAAVDQGQMDIFEALQQQLGLRLESARAPIETLVVDHIERTPTEN
jgi:uncharacterized protein (TIGR03435 family)